MPWGGATRLVPFQAAAAVLPPSCVRLLMLNVPGQLGTIALPRLVLEQAGYTVEEAGAAAGLPVPRPGVVTICQIRPGELPGGAGFHTGTIVAEVVPPPDDPLLQHLPPAMVVGALGGHCVQALIEKDTLAPARSLAQFTLLALLRRPDYITHARA